MIYVFTAVFGLIVGSFLNAVIWRLHSGESPFRGRSHCPKCGKELTWRELIPVFSYILQRGKCRGCGKEISIQYPLVEAATAVLFVVIINNQETITKQPAIINHQTIIETLFLWFAASSLIVLFVYDLKHYIIPDKVLLPLAAVTAGAILFGYLEIGNWLLFGNWKLEIGNFSALISAVMVAVLASLPFAALHFMSQGRWLGFGDVKLAFFMGLFLGYPAIFTAMFLAFTIGAIISLGLVVLGQKSFGNQIPFGPFLIIGTFAALFWSDELINWYLGIFL